MRALKLLGGQLRAQLFLWGSTPYARLRRQPLCEKTQPYPFGSSQDPVKRGMLIILHIIYTLNI